MTRLSRSGLSPRLSAIAGIDTAIIVESSPSIKKAQPTISGMMIRMPSVRGVSGGAAICLGIINSFRLIFRIRSVAFARNRLYSMGQDMDDCGRASHGKADRAAEGCHSGEGEETGSAGRRRRPLFARRSDRGEKLDIPISARRAAA